MALFENLSHKKLLVIPGHVNKDVGTIILADRGPTGYGCEAELNLDIWRYMVEFLAPNDEGQLIGITGGWTRRLLAAEHYKPDAIIELHCNSFSDPKVRGFEAWTAGDGASTSLAESILHCLGSGNPIPAHGPENGLHDIYKEDNPRRRLFEVLKGQSPLVLVEYGFVSNYDDCRLLVDAGFQEVCALRTLLGVDSYFAE